MKIASTVISFILLFLVATVDSYAMAPAPPAPQPQGAPPPVGLPIDNGVCFLLAAGILFSFYKLKQSNYKKTPV